jgi:hypothetical protein
MTFLRWIYSGLVVSILLVIVGIFGNGMFSVGQVSAEDKAHSYSQDIKGFEQRYSLAKFDLKRKSHLLRKMRLEHFIAQAKQADIRGWESKRERFLERADNVLRHHLSQYAYEDNGALHATRISASNNTSESAAITEAKASANVSIVAD